MTLLYDSDDSDTQVGSIVFSSEEKVPLSFGQEDRRKVRKRDPRPMKQPRPTDVPSYTPTARERPVDVPVYEPTPRERPVDDPGYELTPRDRPVDVPAYDPTLRERPVDIPAYDPTPRERPVDVPAYEPTPRERPADRNSYGRCGYNVWSTASPPPVSGVHRSSGIGKTIEPFTIVLGGQIGTGKCYGGSREPTERCWFHDVESSNSSTVRDVVASDVIRNVEYWC